MGFFDFFKGNKNKDSQQDSVENIEITENTEQEENGSCYGKVCQDQYGPEKFTKSFFHK